MFARIKKSGKYDYLQIVENQRVKLIFDSCKKIYL